jgi:hypothetical protein
MMSQLSTPADRQWDELDKTVRDYNPTLAKFAKDSFFARYSPVHGPAKFLMLMLVMGLIQR